ncbi:hypothetical protein [Sphingobium tyrosinilyticum]|uniref:Polysaccharide biosynthesis protein n=1 Tax=Sphingobium tyrosinilyticum TaxID=2715436 RepID=A0ABV9F4N2_9SPHN
MEESVRFLALIKLANVGLTLIWGFAVTYVFVRVLDLREFQTFLLLIAFGNFTISAELGLTSIIYARLRRHWLGHRDEGSGGFRLEEMGVLFLFLGTLIFCGLLILIVAFVAGAIGTTMPLLFMLFFLSACANLPALMAKRALAAVDGNFLWEALDCVRRMMTIALLLLILKGLDPRLSILLQLTISLAVIAYAIALVHKRLGMTARHWLAFHRGAAHVRANYLRDIGASALFTMSEFVAYNAPYFTLALATRDPRPVLLFDFYFKMSRGLSMIFRAMVEATLPRITWAFHANDAPRLHQLLIRAVGIAFLFALAASGALLMAGQWLFTMLFAERASIGIIDLLLIIGALPSLAVVCVSVYIQAALGRFNLLLKISLPFLAGSLLSVPLARLLGEWFDMGFLALYTLTMLVVSGLHALSLLRLFRDVLR